MAVAWLKNKILAWIETTSSKINVWVWHKRWNKRNKNPLENSVHVKNTLVSKNTGTSLGHAIIKNTAVNAIILLVH